MSLTLRPYQTAGLTALAAAEDRGLHRLLLVWPTGVGKTIAFAAWAAARPGRTLLLAHREELLDQAREKIALVAPDADVGIVQADRDETDHQIVVASVATVRNSVRLLACIGGEGFAQVIIDEAHHVAAESYQKVLKTCRLTQPELTLLGVTATPERTDGRALVGEHETFDTIAHRIGLWEAIRDGYLCDLVAKRVRIDLELESVTVRYGDYAPGELEQRFVDCDGADAVANAIEKLASKRKRILVFVPGVESTVETAALLNSRGINTRSIVGDTPAELRRQWLDDFREGTVRVLVNCMVLTEGYDEPAIDCVVIARPTKSALLYQQMLGRGLRPYPGKTDYLVLDGVGASRAATGLTIASILPKQVQDAVEQGASVRDALAGADGKLSDEAIHRPATFAWVACQGGWLLSLGSRDARYLLLRESSAGWDVVLRQDMGDRVVWSGPALEWAQGVAEDVVRDVGVPRILVKADAAWRDRPMSIGQKEAFHRAGLKWTGETTRGEAADALTWLYGTKKRGNG